MRRLVAPALMLAAHACAPAIGLDASEREPEPGLQVEFDPGASIVPFPNNLLFGDGRLSLPAQCGETDSTRHLREAGLNTLDGFATFKPTLSFTAGAPIDPGSAFGTVFLFRMAVDGVPLDPTSATPLPLWTVPGQSVRWGEDCASFALVDNLILVPATPLRERSTYVVAVLDGLAVEGGEALQPSPIWSLVREAAAPVIIAEDETGEPRVVANHTPFDPNDNEGLSSLLGLEQLWKAHEAPLLFVDTALRNVGVAARRDQLLLAWSFDTQTITDPLDPAGDGPAALLGTLATDGASLTEVANAANAATFLEAVLGAGSCAQLPCAAVGSVVSGTFADPSFQVRQANPAGLSRKVPGPWTDPLNPEHQVNETVPLLAVLPLGQAPADGWPTVIFGHGLGGRKENLLALAPQLAAAGIASVAIDWVAHGARAVQVDNREVVGCNGLPRPSAAPHCFAPLLGADLLLTRDNLRQGVLDQLKLVRVLKACGQGACPLLPVDGERLGYVGQSLGALLGGVFVAMANEVQAAVLNVGGAGWVDFLSETETIEIRCPIIDALLDAGVIAGDSRDRWGGNNPGALCLGDAWRTEPGFVQFQTLARWLLDPADGANFAWRLATARRPVLVQEVVGDPVVPNVATRQQGVLLGLTPRTAARASAMPPAPSAAVVAGESAWLRYTTLPAAAPWPGNTYGHGSLLMPTAGAEGALGTAQMQADAITFLAGSL